MARVFTHTATVTLRLPFDMALHEEIEALRGAGIPVNATGNAESGHLFVRRARGTDRHNIFRWFARGFEPNETSAAPGPADRLDDTRPLSGWPQSPSLLV